MDGPNLILALPTYWIADGEKRTWRLGLERSVIKRVIPFRVRQNGRAGKGGKLFECYLLLQQ